MKTWLSRGGLGCATALALGAGGIDAAAQTFVTGTVVDTGGAPVANANLDAFDTNGDEADLTNDGTQSDGTFLTTVNDGPGIYDIRFSPPPGSPLLPVTVEDVFVIGTTDLGTITLPDGNLVTGRVIDSLGSGVEGVDLRAWDTATGEEIFVPNNTTDSLGGFAVALADGTFDLRFDPSGASGATLAPQQLLGVEVSGALDLGDVVLPPGFVISATCEHTDGSPVEDLDVDVVDPATNVKLWTPGDGTDDSGFVDVVVPAGTWDVEFEPDPGDQLVAQVVESLVVGADTDLGTLVFIAGETLSGTVTELATGTPVALVDVDVTDPVTGADVFLASDNTDASGNYEVVVPAGTWDVDFEPPVTLPLRSQLVPGVVVAGDTTLDAALEECPAPVHYGTGTPGTGGFVPTIESTGDPARLGTTNFTLEVSDGLGGAFGFLILGSGDANIPFKTWTLWVDPADALFLLFLIQLDGPAGVGGAGSLALTGEIPYDPALDGFHLYTQVIVLDAGAPRGIAASDGLDVTFCR